MVDVRRYVELALTHRTVDLLRGNSNGTNEGDSR